MNFAIFSLMTVLGAALWCSVLAYLGTQAYRVKPDLFDAGNPQAMVDFIKGQSHWIVIGVVVLAGLYFLMLRLTARPVANVGPTGVA